MTTTTRTILDSTSGHAIKGRIGRFVVTSYRRGDAHEGTPGVFEGVRAVTPSGHGKRALLAALVEAEEKRADRTRSFYDVVSLYDAGMKVWWPCELSPVD
ncbi:MAG: hypothetical protein EPO40_16660 [Myxococcaceae bacterium]|nr:MAG: hypothetical protein EPO40_16660 [Myxococcaceae bacterium]